MSKNSPAPVALTACLIMAAYTKSKHWGVHGCPVVANLASAIHRLAPACRRLAVATCNGEWHDGQRDAIYRWRQPGTTVRPDDADQRALRELEASIEKYATRLDRRIAKLNAELAPFGYQLIRSGDPRGACLRMAETPVLDSATHYSIG